MPKTLDPNHLALMTAVQKGVIDLRKVYERIKTMTPYNPVLADITAIIDRLRLTLKGRIGS
jgi:hypothetical protein